MKNFKLTFKKSVLASFSLHVLLFILVSGILFRSCSDSITQDENQKKDINITESPKEVDVDIVTEDDLKGAEPAKKAKAIERKCPNKWYGGIGIINTFDGQNRAIITSVPKGYPADKAGIQLGDELIDSCPQCIGEVGQDIDVQVRKSDGNITVYHLTREKICTD